MMESKYPTYPKYKNSRTEWLGDIPSEWGLFDGKRLFSNRRELSLETDEQLAASQKYGVVPQSLMIKLNDSKVMLALKGTSSFRHVEKNDFVISLRSFEGGIEHSRYIGCVSPAYTVLSATKKVVPNFYRYLFKSDPYIAALQSTTDSLRDGKSITFDQFGAISLVVPQQEEQEKIVSFLDFETSKVGMLIEKQQQLIKLLKEKRQAVISHAVTKGLNPDAPMRDSGVKWLGEVPEHWSTSKLKHLATQIVDGAHFTPTYVDEGVPFLRVTDVHKNVIDKSNIKYIPKLEHKELIKRCNPEEGDLLLSKNGTIGLPKVVDWDWEFSIFVSLCLIKLNEKVDVHYVYYFFKTYEIKEQISGQIKQSTVINLHLDKIEKFDFTVPPISEQREIIKHLNSIVGKYDLQVRKAREMNVLLGERRTALISAAVTGKIDVRNWQAPEPSSNNTEATA